MIYLRNPLTTIRNLSDGLLVKIIFNEKVTSEGSVVANLTSGLRYQFIFFGILRINEVLAFPVKWASISVLGALLIIISGTKA